MPNVVLFVPRSDRDARANLAEFIRMAKEELTAFASGGAWESDKWEQGDTVIVFATRTAHMDAYAFKPMAEPFKDFAKAYVRYTYSHKPVKSLAVTSHALRCLEAALVSTPGPAEVGKLNAALMDACAAKCREFFSSEEVWYQTGRALKRILDFLREKSLVPSLPDWKPPFKKPVILTEHLGEAGRQHRESKLPSNDTMLAVADLFALADCPATRFYSSIMALMMPAPGRISEVLSLRTDCIQWQPDDSGALQMCIRWRSAKNGDATRKWIVPAMREVVEVAVGRLMELGAAARAAAKLAHEDPDQFARVAGTAEGARAFINRYGGKYWPYVDQERTLLFWEALCIHGEYAFHARKSEVAYSWRVSNANDVNFRMGANGRQSLFEQHDITLGDGSPVRLTTHQLRHWLSTMSERAGMDDYTLAQWAGRAKITDNLHYDHRTPEERLEAAKELLPFKPAPLLERIQHRQPVTFQELGVDRLGTAKATLYGMCVHDYAMAPCQKERECMTCEEHVCIKGDHASFERICLLEAQTELLLQIAKKAHEDGDFGADRWVDNHKWKLAHVRAMRTALEHPHVPDGSILKIPEGHDPSPVRRALIELGMVEVPSLQAINPRVIPSTLV